ncbi:hypothetical protein GLP21_17675 [Photobacterium carnosum]|uniref:Uncharacterized protein n=1 Tax=Photobacterium carnosum TaxID=2023717 RepID=A0A2N4UWE1_9GAMM|nr:MULTISPECIES: hypothetical protein [Photobacterium]MCD9476293.1 hypothetical protein [Photobacterium phosphoreum]MCD9488109.1 hypothetical protein [Photobacterium iliopiscarium]MCD9508069.1 hypothetical protein [Photobacterium phosphoreum]MCD9539192.1 hypothetical protein [Photobacterium carnosum]MCD9542356.1 hypothetical protein [Photobacterium carnosum]
MSLEPFKCYRFNHQNDKAQYCDLDCVVIPLQIDSDALTLIEAGLFNLSWSGVPIDTIENFRRNTLTFPSCTAALGNASLSNAVKLAEKLVHLTNNELKAYLTRNVEEIDRIYYAVHEISPTEWQLVLAAYVPNPLKLATIIESRKDASCEDEYILAEVNIIASVTKDKFQELKSNEINKVNSKLHKMGFNYNVDSDATTPNLCFYLAVYPHELKSALSVIRYLLTTFNIRNDIDINTGYLTVHYSI